MKRLYLFLMLTFICANTFTDQSIVRGRLFFLPRSQGANIALDTVGVHTQLHQYDVNKKGYSVIAATPTFHKSTRPSRIAEALFGTDTLTVSGSTIANRGEQDLLADYFGLSQNFLSTVHLDPTIASFQMNFNAYLHWQKAYLYMKMPVVWTRWNMRLDESITQNGSATDFAAGYMDEGTVSPAAHSFTQAIAGGKTFGDLAEPLNTCKICGPQKKTGFAELQWILGYDIVNRYRGHAGLQLRLGAPTGSRPNGEFVFDALVGNGHHWELGAGVDGHVLLWEKDGEQHLNLWLNTYLSHLFKDTQKRCFDLKDDCFERFASRYVLIKEFDENNNYTGKMFPGANILTQSADVSIPIQFELLIMFAYTHNNFAFDFGYNAWIRAQEKVSLNNNFPNNKYALKGIQDVSIAPNIISDATQSKATVFGNDFADQAAVADTNSPVFIQTSDLDTSSAESPMALTHKIFMHLGYTWHEKSRAPFFGVGGEIEFEGINTRENQQPIKNTMSQWGVWIKGGVGF